MICPNIITFLQRLSSNQTRFSFQGHVMSANAKEFIFEDEARAKLLTGITKLADSISITLGPQGRNVGLDKSWGAPTITNDGNSIVKDISLEDAFENMGVAMAKEAAEKLKEKCGDGTTTVTLLLHSIAVEGHKAISAGASPIGLKRGIEKAVEAVISSLDKSSMPVSSNTEIQDVATVSASGHEEIGRVIAQAVSQVGKNGVITIEEGKSMDTQIDVVEGMEFDRGYISSYFATNADSMSVQMQSPLILVTDRKITSIHDILPLLQSVASSGKELLIIAEDVEGDALSTLIVNRMRGFLKATAVKAPSFGDRRKEILGDLAILTGAQFISDEVGLPLKEAQIEDLGSAQSVMITKDHTTLVGGAGKREKIDARVKQIEAEIARSTTAYDQEKLQERRAKLAGGVAVIRVGSVSEAEMQHRKQMFQDSLSSTKAAMEAGVVPGGGLGLLRAAKAIEQLHLNGDEALGAKIVATACAAPLKQIVRNAGLNPALIISQIYGSEKPNIGFNALNDQIEDLVAAGIQDPTKVTKNCLIHAASLASVILLTEALISDAKEDETGS